MYVVACVKRCEHDKEAGLYKAYLVGFFNLVIALTQYRRDLIIIKS